MKTLALFLALAVSAIAEAPKPFLFPKGEDYSSRITISAPSIQSLTISSGEGKRVVINLKTGEVTHDGSTPDEAAKLFWEAVAKAYPSIRESIAAESKKP